MKESEIFPKAAVAAPHHLAAKTGRDLLAQGANAIEAMLGMAATVAVVYPHMNSIGGDSFWLIREPNCKVLYIEACGTAGSKATIAAYRKKGYIPPRGPGAAVTIPGTVGGYRLAEEIAAAAGGRLPRNDLFADAIRLAREGYPISNAESRAQPLEFDALKQAPGFALNFLIDDKIPARGTERKSPKLADTLEHLVRSGFADFYRGDIGREIAADMERLGIPSTRSDLESYSAILREPLSLKLAGRTHYNTPPPTQGIVGLFMLGLFDRLGPAHAESFEHIHGLVEATKRGLALRDRICTDFAHLPRDPSDYLKPDVLAREAAMIDMNRAAVLPVAAAEGDTVWMGSIDAQGRAVSFIQSVYWEYGSGCVLPATGILMHNRGISFSLDPRALNPLQPGRRPFHTLTAPMAVFDDGRVMPYGSMGGDGQPQFQAQVFLRSLFGLSLAEATDRPRFLFGKLWGAETPTLKLEPRFDESLIRKLKSAGHEIEIYAEPYASRFGHAGALMRRPDGSIEAAHDPRSDGGAAGI
ncbi:MAG: gamma-glutamyltransferase [Methylovirgula sp.]|jgi:gamma-glutamyltranspeptidase/glutathione hydrolase